MIRSVSHNPYNGLTDLHLPMETAQSVTVGDLIRVRGTNFDSTYCIQGVRSNSDGICATIPVAHQFGLIAREGASVEKVEDPVGKNPLTVDVRSTLYPILSFRRANNDLAVNVPLEFKLENPNSLGKMVNIGGSSGGFDGVYTIKGLVTDDSSILLILNAPAPPRPLPLGSGGTLSILPGNSIPSSSQDTNPVPLTEVAAAASSGKDGKGIGWIGILILLLILILVLAFAFH